jgi:hypothetical protein
MPGPSKSWAVTMQAVITGRDKSILNLAALRISWLVVAALYSVLGFKSAETLRKRLDLLSRTGLLLRRQVICRLPEAILRPVFSFNPGRAPAESDIASLAYHLQNRWNNVTPRRMTLYCASPRLLSLYGVGRRPPKEDSHASHDVLLTYVFASYAAHSPHEAAEFFHERYAEAFSMRGFKEVHPDAYLMTGGRPEGVYRVIEAGGSYDKKRVLRLVQDSLNRNIHLEIW